MENALVLIQAALDDIDEFERICESDKYTDTDTAWELLNRLRADLTYLQEFHNSSKG